MIVDNQIEDEKKFRFDGETDMEDQKEIVVSQVDMDHGVVTDVWYQDIVYYLLQNQYPSWMNSSQHRGLKMKCESYMLHDRKLYKRNYEGIYLKCFGQDEVKEVLEQFHDKYGTGHGSEKATARMILTSGYFWPTIFKDTFEYVSTCHIFHTSGNRERHPTMPLQPVLEI